MATIKYICGNPASGKTTFISKFKDELGGGFVLDYNNYKDWSLLQSGCTSQQIHDLSVKIGQETVKPHICDDIDIIFECTLSNLMSKSLLRNMRILKNRGYRTELYLLIDDIALSRRRNGKREHPAPDNIFVDINTCEHLFSDYSNFEYIQCISEITSDKLYCNQTFYKGFGSEQQAGKTIYVDGVLARDKNAIYFANNAETARLYGEYVYRVEVVGTPNRHFNTFYSNGVKIISLLGGGG